MQKKNWTIVWLLCPAILIAFLQICAIPAVSSNLGMEGFIAFQTMMAVGPWLNLVSGGLDKRARGFYSLPPLTLEKMAQSWRALALLAFFVAAIVSTLLLIFNSPSHAVAWALFITLGMVSGVAIVGREALLGSGYALRVAKLHSFALGASLIGMLVAMITPMSLNAVIVIFMLPQLCAWIACCHQAGLLKKIKLGSPWLSLAQIESSRFLLQGFGILSLATLDVLAVGLFFPTDVVIGYILTTRVLALGFTFATGLVNPLIALLKNNNWHEIFLKATLIHCTLALCGAVGLILGGVQVFDFLGIKQGLNSFRDNATSMVFLCFARGIVEAGTQLSGGDAGIKVFQVSLLSFFGLAVFMLLLYLQCAPLMAVAVGWGVPAIFYARLCLLAYNKPASP